MFKKVKKRNNQKVELDHTTEEAEVLLSNEVDQIKEVEMMPADIADPLD